MAKRTEYTSEVPISAMIDVTFLLLIYFIVMQKEVKEESYVAVNQPALNPGPPPPVLPTTCDIHVRPDAYHSRGQAYPTVDGLLPDLEHFAANSEVDPDDPMKRRKNVIVNLKLSVHATQQQLVDLLDTLAKYDLTKINFFYLKGAVDAPVP
ncbi:MAG: Biopolymer transport protein ExbD/TolR [Verrucomicrobiota bacterium]|jgi:biopolymer transport protein ExbD